MSCLRCSDAEFEHELPVVNVVITIRPADAVVATGHWGQPSKPIRARRIVSSTNVSDLVLTSDGGHQTRGIRLAGWSAVAGDLVLTCGDRRSPVPSRLVTSA